MTINLFCVCTHSSLYTMDGVEGRNQIKTGSNPKKIVGVLKDFLLDYYYAVRYIF